MHLGVETCSSFLSIMCVYYISYIHSLVNVTDSVTIFFFCSFNWHSDRCLSRLLF
jgi:hypothetical protein